MNSKLDRSEKSKLFYSRAKLVFIFTLFLGPLVVAFVWYYGLGAILVPGGKANHAPLINPVVTLTPFENSLYDNRRITLESLKHKWTFIHIVHSPCEELCQKSLYNTRQIRIALGKGANRVQRYVIVGDRSLADKIQRNHADAGVIKLSDGGLVVQLLPIMERHRIGVNDAILIDPLGNVMMLIPIGLDPRLLLKDLKKLLKLSRIG